jgi:hypothetical protein
MVPLRRSAYLVVIRSMAARTRPSTLADAPGLRIGRRCSIRRKF